MKPVILAGGTGSRLWPKSRAALPKQFLSLTSEHTMLQNTIARLPETNKETPIVICNDAHRFMVAEQLRADGIAHGGIILEPVGKNTAPAIALALQAIKSNETLMIMPADHFIPDVQGFEKSAFAAQGQASREFIVTIGISPKGPHTGYGYIQTNAYGDVEKFHEKPDKKTAENYLENPYMYWNSGIFTATRDTLIKEYHMHSPDLLKGALTDESFAALKPISFDYAIAEKTFNAVMVKAEFEWNDIGDWKALASLKTGRL